MINEILLATVSESYKQSEIELKISKLDGKVKASVPQNFKECLPPVASKSGVKYKNNLLNESVAWLFETASRMILNLELRIQRQNRIMYIKSRR